MSAIVLVQKCWIFRYSPETHFGHFLFPNFFPQLPSDVQDTLEEEEEGEDKEGEEEGEFPVSPVRTELTADFQRWLFGINGLTILGTVSQQVTI